MARKLWNIVEYNKQRAVSLADRMGIDEFAALMLISRGFDTEEKINGFFDTSLDRLYDPYLLTDMKKAVERIRAAIQREEKICVYGDYDADGVTATVLLYSYLQAIGADVCYYIPSRLTEGYGLTDASAQKVLQTGSKLVITVDNGISSVEEARFFAENGIDLIVTDHHQVGDTLPAAVAVIDPHRTDDSSPFSDLSGVGVAFKLACALEDGDFSSVFENFGDLVTLGTVADIVPLVGENRILVANGLPGIENTQRPGLLTLINALGFGDKPVNSTLIAFGIAPKINAAGRMATADKAVRLLLTEDEREAQALVDEIMALNTARQTAEAFIVDQATEQIEASPLLQNERVLVVAARDWHPGVMGIAASRLVEKYGKPTIVISVDETGMGKGSCRGLDGFCLFDALTYCKDELIRFGGHTLAAGLSVREDNIERFAAKINEYAEKNGDIFPVLNIDCKLNPAYLTTDILDSLQLLEPFGAENPTPTFGIFGVTVTGIKPIGNNKHLRLSVTKQGVNLQVLYFGKTLEDFCYKENDTVDLAVRIEKNEYRGVIGLSIQMKDIRPANTDDRCVFSQLSAVQALKRGQAVLPPLKQQLFPDRALLGQVFRFVKQQKECELSAELIAFRLGAGYQKTGAVQVCLDALTEIGVLNKTPNGYRDAMLTDKADLSSSALLNALRE